MLLEWKWQHNFCLKKQKMQRYIRSFQNALKQKVSSVKAFATWIRMMSHFADEKMPSAWVAYLFLRVVFAVCSRETPTEHSRTEKEIFWQNRVSKGSQEMIKAGQTGRIRKRILYQDEEKQTQRESGGVAGDQTRNFINCVWGCTGSSNYCILHHQRAIGRARGVAIILSSERRDERFICCLHPARKGFRFLSISCAPSFAGVSLIF